MTEQEVRYGLKVIADAVRKGASIRPQAFMDFFVQFEDDTEVRSCAIGAAHEGLGGRPKPGVGITRVKKRITNASGIDIFDGDLTFSHPVIGTAVYHSLYTFVFTLNDVTRLTREDIADVLESPALRINQ
jgi:hypothetical protein